VSGSQATPAQLRILFWCPYVNLGGGARLLARLVGAVARHRDVEWVRLALPEDARLVVETAGASPEKLSVFPLRPRRKAFAERHGRIVGFGGSWYPESWTAARSARHDGRWRDAQVAAASEGCDLIYVFWPHVQDALESRVPVVSTIQDVTMLDYPEIFSGPGTRREFQRLREWLLRSKMLVVSSEATRRGLARHFGEIAHSARRIPHAISPFSPEERAAAPRLPGPFPERYLLYPGNIAVHKNHFNLLIAWSRFVRRHDLRLVLCGYSTEVFRCRAPSWPDCWQSSRLMGIASRCGLEEGRDLTALGYVSDQALAGLIAHADALVMPSLAEGGGSFPVEEALSLGVPVLCSDIPVMREHLEGRTARIGWFDPESPDDIARAMGELLDDYDAYKRSAIEGMGDPRPSWDDVAAAYVSVFREACQRQGE
jgi:glycosyltransferase involved in cell wall biosynthesis